MNRGISTIKHPECNFPNRSGLGTCVSLRLVRLGHAMGYKRQRWSGSTKPLFLGGAYNLDFGRNPQVIIKENTKSGMQVPKLAENHRKAPPGSLGTKTNLKMQVPYL